MTHLVLAGSGLSVHVSLEKPELRGLVPDRHVPINFLSLDFPHLQNGNNGTCSLYPVG